MKIATFLSLSSCTFSAVWCLKENLPSERTRIALRAFCLPSCVSIWSASAIACARLVKPPCHCMAAISLRTRTMSSVRPCTAIAGLIVVVPSGIETRRPLPKSPMPRRTADWPRYRVAYLPLSAVAKLRSVTNPSWPSELLESTSMTKSCSALQSSSPMQSCVLHRCSSMRSPESVLGHLPRPRIGTSTGRVREVMPPPQAAEQVLHLLQSSSLQS
mmetsp:Transcript_96407/g.190962  ORF Transcript_96407/g.190962 Transcript_96407/m.190962 type:complete len:216 (-) Transcript_96407:1258-1905(-)